MNIKYLSSLFLAFIGLFAVSFFLYPVAYSAPTDLESVNTNASNITNGLFKTTINSQSGMYATVNTNREVVTLMSNSQNVIWSTNVIEGTMNMSLPGEKEGGKIQGMQMQKGDLWVQIGRGYVIIDINTGNIKGSVYR